MKLCLYTNTIYKIGGVARVTTFTANQWAQEHDVTIISTNPDYEPQDLVYELDNRIHTIQDPSLFDHDDAFQLTQSSRDKLASLIHDHAFDGVIGVEGKYAVALASALESFKGLRLAWMHNSFDAYFRTEGEYLWQLDDAFTQAMRQYDEVIVLTQRDKQKFDAHFDMASKCIVNPITFDIPTPTYNQESKKLLTVCRVVYKHKGLDLFLETCPMIFEKHPDWSWHLVGDGPDLEDLKMRVQTMGLSNHVIIHGPTHNVIPFYEDAALFVLPSRWEGMPMVSLEAMSFALPLVGFNIDALQEVLGESLSSLLLVEKYDKAALAACINHLIEDAAFRMDASNQITQRINLFTLEAVSKEWQTLFTKR